MQMTIDERKSRLIEWLEIIQKDLQILLHNQHIFRELQKIVEQNPRFAKSSGLFTQWMASNYAQATAVGIRRFAKYNEKDKDSVSLLRFLNEVKNHSDLITRHTHLELYQGEGAYPHMGQNVFDEVAGEGNDRLPTSLIDRQIDELKKSVHEVEKYVDRRIAHYDRREPKIPTFGDLSDALESMEKIVILYRLLLTGQAMSSLLPTIQGDWMSIFQFSWVEPDNSD